MTSLSPEVKRDTLVERKFPGKLPGFTQLQLGDTYLSSSESKDDIAKKLEGRSLLMFLTNTETSASLLVPATTDYAYNFYFRNLIIQVDKEDLEPYNLTSIPLQDKQLVIVLTDVPLTVSTIMTMSINDPYSLKMRTIQCFQIVDKFQSYLSMGQDLRFITSSWLQSLIQDNQRFWGKLRDAFPALFSIRKFRLELKRNQPKLGDVKSMLKERTIDLNEGPEILLRSAKVRAIVGSDEWKEVLQRYDPVKTSLKEETEDDIKDKTAFGLPYKEEYQELGEKNRTYADIYDQQFASMRPDEYQKYMNIEELMFIGNTLLRLKEYSLLIKLWTILAVNFDFYHLAINLDFFKLVDQVDIYGVMGKFIKPLMYLMYKEESNIRTEAKEDMRHVTSLRQLEAMGWLYTPCPMYKTRETVILPLKSSFNRPYDIPPRLASMSSFQARLSHLSMGVLDQFPDVPDVYITGGIMSLALIHSGFEMLDWFNISTKSGKTLDSTAYYRPAEGRSADGRATRAFMWNWRTLGPNLEYMKVIEEKSYKGADIDIAVLVDNDEDWIRKKNVLFPSMNKRVQELKLEIKEGWHAVDDNDTKYRLELTNGHAIEVFRVNKTRAATPLALVFDFHVPPVRAYYDPRKKDVFMLPSCLWAAWTGLCLDIKYFASVRDPLEILLKYETRGYNFLFNTFEDRLLNVYRNLSFNQGREMIIFIYNGLK